MRSADAALSVSLRSDPDAASGSIRPWSLQRRRAACETLLRGHAFQRRRADYNKMQKKLAVVFPMTYELEEEYLATVQNALKDVAFCYDIIIQRMTELQLLSLRKISDIVVNIQVIDSLSASLQEHIFCGGVLIAGEWLPYSLFTDHGIYYIKSGVSDLSEKLLDTIQNLDTLKRKCGDNGQRIYALTSWQAVIERWKDIYLRLDNS